MNVFVLDQDIKKAVRYQCDRHVVKMTLESAQMLSTVQRLYGNDNPLLYKTTHPKHPWVIWTAASRQNYLWHVEFFDALAEEYALRYRRVHRSYARLAEILKIAPEMPDIGFTAQPMAMPDQFKSEDLVESYRSYYIGMKLGFSRWTEPATIPDWIPEEFRYERKAPSFRAGWVSTLSTKCEHRRPCYRGLFFFERGTSMQAYLALMKKVMDEGVEVGDRTGVGRRSLFGQSLVFDLANDGFPLVTSRRISLKVAAEELFWFISGSSDTRELEKAGVKIWQHWAVTEQDVEDFIQTHLNDQTQLVELGLDTFRRIMLKDYVGSVGPIYGPNWRKLPNTELGLLGELAFKHLIKHHGIEALLASDVRARIRQEIEENTSLLDEDQKEDLLHGLYYEELVKNVDQLHLLLHGLKHHPESRRHVLTAWIPQHVPFEVFGSKENVLMQRGALAPCHAFVQFFVDTSVRPYRLSSLLYQRSCDLPVGAPYNIAQYSLLTHLIAHSLSYQVGQFHYMLGDVHIYTNQYEGVKEQLSRKTHKLPTLTIVSQSKELYDYRWSDLRLDWYQHSGDLSYPIAI